jgi:hypothetical protein
MTIVVGLDQHRAQITAEWIDTEGQRLDVSGGGQLEAQLDGLVAAGDVQHAEQSRESRRRPSCR